MINSSETQILDNNPEEEHVQWVVKAFLGMFKRIQILNIELSY